MIFVLFCVTMYKTIKSEWHSGEDITQTTGSTISLKVTVNRIVNKDNIC